MFFIKRFQFFYFLIKNAFLTVLIFCVNVLFTFMYLSISTCVGVDLSSILGGKSQFGERNQSWGLESRYPGFWCGEGRREHSDNSDIPFQIELYTCVYGVSAQTSCVEVVDPEIHDPPDFKPD